MKVTILSLFLVLTSFYNLANACPGSSIEINNSSWLRADGIYGSNGIEHDVTSMEVIIKSSRRPVWILRDKDGKNTHYVEFLGSTKDDGGVIQSAYALKDISSGNERTVVLKSNYRGNGVTARSVDPVDTQLKARNGFENLFEAGCR